MTRDPARQDSVVPGSEAICTLPNRFARTAGIELHEHSAFLYGYQEFVLTADCAHALASDLQSRTKQNLLAHFFQPRYLKNRSVLELGANNGLFCFQALQSGAESATAVDIDQDYLQNIEAAKARLGFEGLRVFNANVSDWEEQADVVLALALVHWIYSCTATLGSLESVIEKLAGFTRYLLLIEWVDPDDSAIGFFGHLDWNQDIVTGPYSFEEFEKALHKYFARVEPVGEVTGTRRLFAAYHARHEIDLSGPLPFVHPRDTILSRRRVATFEGLDYWSCVYDLGDSIYKQTTSDLALRSAGFLRSTVSRWFPRILDSGLGDGYSFIEVEKIVGTSVEDAIDEICATEERFAGFFDDCLALLEHLRLEGVVHRDIHSGNLFLREGRPVLIDFDWAVEIGNSYFTPEGLGLDGRPPDGTFSDVYSMGRLLQKINQGRYMQFDPILDLMTEADPQFRISDSGLLRFLVDSVRSLPL